MSLNSVLEAAAGVFFIILALGIIADLRRPLTDEVQDDDEQEDGR